MTGYADLPPQLVVERVDGLLGAAATAVFSPCRTWRYALARQWGPKNPPAVFVMLNPSTADAFADDPTIRRCVRFAKDWGAGGLLVLNLFALRATDPQVLRGHADPVGPDNDLVIETLLGGDRSAVVCAWGSHGTLAGRARTMLDLLRRRGVRPMCLGATRGGQPRHPLYMPANTTPYPFTGAGADPAAAIHDPAGSVTTQGEEG